MITQSSDEYPQQSSAPQANPWVEYFGRPAFALGEQDSSARQPYDRYDLPKAYEGRNDYIRQAIEGFVINKGDLLWTRELLPIERRENPNFNFSTWYFNETFAGRVPHEGISRVVQSQKTEHSGKMVRRGLALILEHGFMNTAMGRQQYMLNILQIVQAIQITLNFDVLSTILTCKRFNIQWMRQHGYFRDQIPMLRKKEVARFGIIQKNAHGFDVLIEEHKKQLMDMSGVTADALIIPQSVTLYLPMVPKENHIYSNRGDLGVKRFEAGAITEFRSLRIYAAKPTSMGKNRLPVDLLCSGEQIGHHNIMAYDENSNPATYRSSNRTIMIYNCASDMFEPVSFLDAVKSAMRFDENGQVDEDHNHFLGAYKSKNNHNDYFLYQDVQWDGNSTWAVKGWKPVTFFGQVHKTQNIDYLSKPLLSKVIATVKNALSERVLHDFEDGCLLIEELKRQGDKSAKFYKGVQKLAANTESDDSQRASKFLVVFEKVWGHLKQCFPNSELLRVPTTVNGASHEWVKKLGMEDATHDEALKALTYLALFGERDKDLYASVDLLGIDVTQVNAPLTEQSLDVIHENNIKALGHSEALDSELYTSAVKKYKSGSTLHKKVVTGVAHLIGTHADNLNNSQFTKRFAMLADLTGRTRDDMKHIARIGLDVVPVETQRNQDLPTRTEQPQILFKGASSFLGSPLHLALSCSHKSTEISVDDASNISSRVSNIFSRANKSAKRAEPTEVEAIFELETLFGGDFGFNANFTTKNFVDRVHMVENLPNALDRLVAYMLLTSRLSLESIDAMYENDIVVPFDVLLTRPFMEFEMMHAAMLKSGKETGVTFIGGTDFQLGDDVQSKLHYGNYTFRAKAVVTQNRNIQLLKNIGFKNYKGGFNNEFWTKEKNGHMDKHEDIFAMADRPSIFSMIVPCGLSNHRKVLGPDPIDLRTALPYYSYVLKMDGLEPKRYDEEYYIPNSQASINTLCYQGPQYSYDSTTESMSRMTMGTGHLGPNIYAGVREVYEGEMKYIENKNYTQSF